MPIEAQPKFTQADHLQLINAGRGDDAKVVKMYETTASDWANAALLAVTEQQPLQDNFALYREKSSALKAKTIKNLQANLANLTQEEAALRDGLTVDQQAEFDAIFGQLAQGAKKSQAARTARQAQLRKKEKIVHHLALDPESSRQDLHFIDSGKDQRVAQEQLAHQGQSEDSLKDIQVSDSPVSGTSIVFPNGGLVTADVKHTWSKEGIHTIIRNPSEPWPVVHSLNQDVRQPEAIDASVVQNPKKGFFKRVADTVTRRMASEHIERADLLKAIYYNGDQRDFSSLTDKELVKKAKQYGIYSYTTVQNLIKNNETEEARENKSQSQQENSQLSAEVAQQGVVVPLDKSRVDKASQDPYQGIRQNMARVLAEKEGFDPPHPLDMFELGHRLKENGLSTNPKDYTDAAMAKKAKKGQGKKPNTFVLAAGAAVGLFLAGVPLAFHFDKHNPTPPAPTADSADIGRVDANPTQMPSIFQVEPVAAPTVVENTAAVPIVANPVIENAPKMESHASNSAFLTIFQGAAAEATEIASVEEKSTIASASDMATQIPQAVGAAVAEAITTQENAPVDNIYVVQKGDNLWDIAGRTYNNPWLAEALGRANEIKDNNFILVGQEIKLPPEADLYPFLVTLR